MAKNSGRRLILVRSDLLERVAGITAREGRTLFSFTNEVFERAIEAYDAHATLAEALEFHRMMKTGRNLGCIVVPSDVFNSMAKKLYTLEPQELLNEWYQSGLWNGNYLSIRFHNQNQLEVVKSFMKASLWNLDEFIVDVGKDSVRIKCFSPNLNVECVEMLAKFLRGMFNALGYSVKSNRCLKGIMMMEMEKQKDGDITPKIHLELET
jgi:hypothetical protein